MSLSIILVSLRSESNADRVGSKRNRGHRVTIDFDCQAKKRRSDPRFGLLFFGNLRGAHFCRHPNCAPEDCA
jgi:hypothetical protein